MINNHLFSLFTWTHQVDYDEYNAEVTRPICISCIMYISIDYTKYTS